MNNSAVKQKMSLLNKEIKKKIFIGASKSYNREVKTFFSNHPSGMKTTLQYFKPLTVSGETTQDVIATFSEGYPAILQLGPNGSANGYSYPYDSKEGTFVSFSESPSLKEWVDKNYGYSDVRDGIKVGKESTTGFGKPYNRWVTISGVGLKTNSATKSTILSEVRSIKLK